MFLKKVHIEHYRSISNLSLNLSGKVTTLVGANEHGKTSILKAINVLGTSVFNEDIDYQLNGQGETSKKLLPSIKWEFSLSNEETNIIQDWIADIMEDESIPEEKKSALKAVKSYPQDFTYKLSVDSTDGKIYYSIPEITNTHLRDLYKKSIDQYRNKVIYFDDVQDRAEEFISRASIEAEKPTDIVRGILMVSGLYEKRKNLFTNDIGVQKAFETASKKLTTALKDFWQQGDSDGLKIKVHKNSTGEEGIYINIEDGNTYNRISNRSRGFRWFLTFFFKYRAYADGEISDSLLLIDEPGLFLHPLGQKDLVAYFNTLGIQNQIVFSTHSPFLINRNKPEQVQVVQKTKKGTEVISKGAGQNWRPMRSALGITLADSFYFSEKTLLVEGMEDRIYITSLLQYLISIGGNIDLNEFSVIEAGGATNLPSMVRLLSDEEHPLCVLIDNDSERSYNQLVKIKGSLKTGKNSPKPLDILKVDEIREKAISIQDLLPMDLYARAVNSYASKLETEGIIIHKGEKTSFLISINDINLAQKTSKWFHENFLFSDKSEIPEKGDAISKFGISREFELALREGFGVKDSTNGMQYSLKLITKLVELLNLKI